MGSRVVLSAVCLAFIASAASASAATPSADGPPALFAQPARDVWHVDWASPDTAAAPTAHSPIRAAVLESSSGPGAQTSPPPKAFEYSDAYKTRAKIHRYASFATLPLIATEIAMGQSLYNASSDGKKTAHIVVGFSILGLFGVNTVTGVWNLVEARKDPNGRGRRLAHGLLMLAADSTFLATVAVAPSAEDSNDFAGAKSTHRAMALTSMGLATAGYLIMLFGGH